MTVAELIDKLLTLPQDARVYVRETSSVFLEEPTPQLRETSADGYCIASERSSLPIDPEPAVIL